MRNEITDLFHWFVTDLHLSFERFIPKFVKHIFNNSLKPLEPYIMNESLDHGYILCQHLKIFVAVP
ncbi:hypothetical protein H5410_053267 [Solanum commersonii]|uniref:Uncharacterized protein n=1 Tax=Solanum commersonii TaxID=4109 RepID=A0A9J5X6K9_SOLCO|nr:hypothetical protein H5410_053267 [Solanum commersonii]